MKRKLCSIALLSMIIFIATPYATAKPAINMSEEEALQVGTDAYIYGYPLITMDMTKAVMTNVAAPEGGRGPIGRFINMREYPNASYRDITTPNADTLYSIAWLDLAKEPYVLHLPSEKDRYYLMPILSGWTNVIAALGTRETGNKAHDFLIAGPHWKGTIPKGMTMLMSPTDMVWIIGRTYCTGTPEDYKLVHDIQDQYSLTPLSFYGKPYTPPAGVVNPDVDMKISVRDQVNAMDAASYFRKLVDLMRDNPPIAADTPMIIKLAKIGMTPGDDFDINKLPPAVIKGLNAAVKAGQEKIMAHDKTAGVIKHGWVMITRTGAYGTDYLQRAFITAVGLGANLPQDAIYSATTVDSEDKTLNGTNQYVIHFAKGKTPPVKGFWSLTMYDTKYFFVNNPLNRYTLSKRNALKYNDDGSLNLYIQHESPGKENESNWLPAPAGDFILMFRFYWPEQKILNGDWDMPYVKQV